MIERNLAKSLLEAASKYPVVTLTGPRQSGKSTLCRALFSDRIMVSLEDPDQRAFAEHDPRGFLAQLGDEAVIDEVQRVPELLSYLQGMVDANPRTGRYILTGSQNLGLLQQVTQSLAGRTALLYLMPCTLDELSAFDNHPKDLASVMFHGGYPPIFDRNIEATRWHRDYVATYLERDVRQILNVGDLSSFQTFLGLCAGRSAQLLNLSALGGDAGITHATAKSWISVLDASFVAYRLRPYHRNFNKRLIKAPKLLFIDSGLLCYLLGIETAQQLWTHPLRGAVFETWVASEVIKARYNQDTIAGTWFFRDQRGREIDLVIEQAGKVIAVECKSGQTIAEDFFEQLAYFKQLTDSDPAIEHCALRIVYGGDHRQQRHGASVIPWSAMAGQSWLPANTETEQ